MDDPAAFAEFLPVPEEAGAHVVLLGRTDGALLMAAGAPRTAELFSELGYRRSSSTSASSRSSKAVSPACRSGCAAEPTDASGCGEFAVLLLAAGGRLLTHLEQPPAIYVGVGLIHAEPFDAVGNSISITSRSPVRDSGPARARSGRAAPSGPGVQQHLVVREELRQQLHLLARTADHQLGAGDGLDRDAGQFVVGPEDLLQLRSDELEPRDRGP